MIVNLRGTSGSGKSTIVRLLTSLYSQKLTYYIPGRKRPIGYRFMHPNGGKDLSLIGHYETPCGGCDTIMELSTVFDLVRRSHEQGTNVLFEGLLLSAEFWRSELLHKDGYPFMIVSLDTPIETCVESINDRRRKSFEDRLERTQAMNLVKTEHGHKLLPLPEYRGDVSPRNTIAKFTATRTTAKRLQESGVLYEWHDRDGALARLREVFEI